LDGSLFDMVGEDTLRRVIKDFYDHVFADPMIGFFFVGKDKARLIDKEFELAARMLGGTLRYTGTPIRQAHARHAIMGGHFERRLQLLREAMDRHGLSETVKAAWIKHTQELRSQVTNSECK
jgi:hemoglobin